MVRTKDLVLILSVLLMLGIAISTTIAGRMLAEKNTTSQIGEAGALASPAYDSATPKRSEDTRAELIERLRAELAQGDVITASPSVEAPTPPETTTTLSCGAPQSGIEVARAWPLSGVSVRTQGGWREVVVASAQPAVASSTAPQAPTRVLLQLPLFASAVGEPTCLDSELIGVTVSGSLLFNADAILYRNSGSETLVGYARDGFPIYGGYSGETDACGGYQSAAGYRYTAAPERSTFISCFMGVPRTFTP